MVIKFETTFGHASSAGATEEARDREIAPGASLLEVTGPMQAIFATYKTEELKRIDDVIAAKGIEIGEFNTVTAEGAELIKAELDKIVVTPPGEKIVSKAAIEQVSKLLWQHQI